MEKELDKFSCSTHRAAKVLLAEQQVGHSKNWLPIQFNAPLSFGIDLSTRYLSARLSSTVKGTGIRSCNVDRLL
jgi:hypothetical protein